MSGGAVIAAEAIRSDLRAEPATAPVQLFSLPWMKAGWPCLGIASLKAALEANGIGVTCRHLHLETAARLGWDNYEALSEVWGPGEALFGALIDPDDAERLKRHAAESLRTAGSEAIAEWAEGPAVEELGRLVDRWIEDSGALRTPVVGVSVGAMQMCGSIHFVRRLRALGHEGLRVLGGSGLVGSVASMLLDRVAAVDFVVNGEGEVAFEALVRRHLEGNASDPIPPGVVARDGAGRPRDATRAATVDLSRAPVPDLDEFYDTAARHGVPTTALSLSFEHSRGCEWEHRAPGKLRGCTFCGLYRTSPDFRRKPVDMVADQVRELVNRHRCLNLAFVDAYLPERRRDDLLDALNGMEEDITFFSELRCDLDEGTARRIASRARQVQLGVESFSTSILKTIGKGVSAAHSVHNVRMCQELGIPLQYNLMVEIPGVDVPAIEALAADLPALYGLVPPQVAHFYLDRNSLMGHEPERHGLRRDRMDLRRHEWLPHCLGDNAISQIVSYEHDAMVRVAWKAVEERVGTWKKVWRRARENRALSPLSWRGGAGWTMVTDMRGSSLRIIELDGILHDVFAHCRAVTTLEKLAAFLPTYEQSDLSKTLDALVEANLVFRDGTRHVGVAIHACSSAAM